MLKLSAGNQDGMHGHQWDRHVDQQDRIEPRNKPTFLSPASRWGPAPSETAFLHNCMAASPGRIGFCLLPQTLLFPFGALGTLGVPIWALAPGTQMALGLCLGCLGHGASAKYASWPHNTIDQGTAWVPHRQQLHHRHACSHVPTHAHAHARTHHNDAHTLEHMWTCMHGHHTHRHTMHVYAQARQIHACTHHTYYVHMAEHGHVCTHTAIHTHTHAHKCMQARTTLTHVCTHMHTHLYTHVSACLMCHIALWT